MTQICTSKFQNGTIKPKYLKEIIPQLVISMKLSPLFHHCILPRADKLKKRACNSNIALYT